MGLTAHSLNTEKGLPNREVMAASEHARLLRIFYYKVHSYVTEPFATKAMEWTFTEVQGQTEQLCSKEIN